MSLEPKIAEALARLQVVVGPHGWIGDASEMAPYLTDWRGLATGSALAVLRPASTREVAEIVSHCREAEMAIVPQGGNTGLVAGGIPGTDGREVVVSLSRMTRIRELDPADFSITVEAGCTLAQVQAAARESDRLFPLSLSAEGSCQIGGNISTNAGGIMTLRYGNMRDLVLGLEVVLPDGRIWNGLRKLRKNNTGYDLKHIFIAAEGTLGIVTAATLKLFPRPHRLVTALAAVASPQDSVDLLSHLRATTGDALSAFELMPRLALELGRKHLHRIEDPFGVAYPWYILIEADMGSSDIDVVGLLENSLSTAIERAIVQDATVAQNLDQTQQLWRLRDGLAEVQKIEGGSIRHDISVPISKVPAFLEQATKVALEMVPGGRPMPFGHVGDGNIHFNIVRPENMAAQEFHRLAGRVNRAVHDIVLALGGSISAEHGIGVTRKDELLRTIDPIELDLMRSMKSLLDPKNLMNPGKLLPT